MVVSSAAFFVARLAREVVFFAMEQNLGQVATDNTQPLESGSRGTVFSD